jgi:hypothetical protein
MHWIDHDFLPDIGGTVERFIVNHHGEIDGLVLEYETRQVRSGPSAASPRARDNRRDKAR